MDKDILKEALAEVRKELRGRIGKKLLTIEVKTPEDEEEDEEEVPAVESIPKGGVGPGVKTV